MLRWLSNSSILYTCTIQCVTKSELHKANITYTIRSGDVTNIHASQEHSSMDALCVSALKYLLHAYHKRGTTAFPTCAAMLCAAAVPALTN